MSLICRPTSEDIKQHNLIRWKNRLKEGKKKKKKKTRTLCFPFCTLTSLRNFQLHCYSSKEKQFKLVLGARVRHHTGLKSCCARAKLQGSDHDFLPHTTGTAVTGVGVGRGYGGGGGGGEIILSLHCHHRNDSCIKMASDESPFNISLIVRDKVTRQCPQTTTGQTGLWKRH